MAVQIPWWKRVVAGTVIAVLLCLTVSGYIFNWHDGRRWRDVLAVVTVSAMVLFRLIHWTPRRKFRRHIGS